MNKFKSPGNPAITILACIIIFAGCNTNRNNNPRVYTDTPYTQDFSIKYRVPDKSIRLRKVVCDRNGYVQILSSAGLIRPRAGEFLFPGTLVKDTQYKPTSDRKITDIGIHDGQIIYLDSSAVFSNARAGKLYLMHNLPGAETVTGGEDLSFVVSDGKSISLLIPGEPPWEADLRGEEVREIKYDRSSNRFIILADKSVNMFDPVKKRIEILLSADSLSCIEINSNRFIAGTGNGYLEYAADRMGQPGKTHRVMPWNEITTASFIGGNLWLGSTRGAMMQSEEGKYNYYSSERWLPSDTVIHISEGPGNSVLVLTPGGLSKICFREMTLHEKALFFERQVRERHIRHGFNATLSSMKNGDVTTGSLADSDNDGLWTSLYLAGQGFRYAVTGSEEALDNIRESLDAMERLYAINNIPGFPSRSFERRGYKYDDPPWRRADDPGWDWKSTTSSDEAIGHIFAFGVLAEVVGVPDVHEKAVRLIDTLMSHIIKNDLYLVDWDGKPTRWGRWNPEYVNGFPEMVGDRKLNSSNIIGMLQTAYKFTGKEKYRQAARNLINNHGYLDNLRRPMSEIGRAPAGSDELSMELSDGWNHSDDEMYFCGYWGLYRYALNDSLKRIYGEAIIDHFIAEKPEKDGLWNIMTAITGTRDFGLEDAIWYLKEYPMDLTDWTIANSHRKDIIHMEENFRNQVTQEVLPPDELRISRHNANRFIPDGGSGGRSEYSAGDIWLLPYWLGRYLGVISGPKTEK